MKHQIIGTLAVILSGAAIATTTDVSRADNNGCSSDGETCGLLSLVRNTERGVFSQDIMLQVTRSDGDTLNIRQQFNGADLNQISNASGNVTWDLGPVDADIGTRNMHIHVALQSCQSGTFSSNCGLWANAFPDVFTPPNFRPFTNAQIKVGGKCLDLPGWATTNGTPIQLFTCNQGANQEWSLDGDGTIHSALNANKCIDMPGFNSSNGTRLQLFDCNGGPNQIWSYEPDNTLRGFNGQCMDLTGFNTADKTPIQIWSCSSNWNQQFVN